MIAVDTSALIAILQSESEAISFVRIITGDNRPVMAAPTYVETSAVGVRVRANSSVRPFERLIDALGIEVIDFDREHARIAREAYERYGRGSGHPAALNLGDCFSYAIAKRDDVALLYKGRDFTHTDIRSAYSAD